ncbi:hypothetical protein B4Q04_22070 [Zobellia sp. OII3]|uniref:DUF1801 domain-containing protein n=1 Tax=Zobellia sp. OII3 TaxID=2034520 RepID=UPI000B5322D8|nr:DUF1801 domain-containing protein [Zobellia sp. OII3]OWW23146.1 hypothetical protein B4Q04_22070 [Zobellia sp. OII3]
MTRQLINLNTEVTALLEKLNHPFRNEIELLRIYILQANNRLEENIKWNGPNYSIDNEDRITMRVQPPTKQIQLIFHIGAKKQEQPNDKLIANKSQMLVWKKNDRAIVTFKSLHHIERGKTELTTIVNEWIKPAK